MPAGGLWEAGCKRKAGGRAEAGGGAVVVQEGGLGTEGPLGTATHQVREPAPEPCQAGGPCCGPFTEELQAQPCSWPRTLPAPAPWPFMGTSAMDGDKYQQSLLNPGNSRARKGKEMKLP